MIRRRVHTVTGAAALLAAALLLTGCGIVQNTVEGFKGSPPPAGSSGGTGRSEIRVEVRLRSDAATARAVQIELDSTRNPQSLRKDTVKLPFRQQYRIGNDSFLPFRGVTASAQVGQGGTFIACEIAVDGKIVDSRRSDGAGARVACERKLRLGPS